MRYLENVQQGRLQDDFFGGMYAIFLSAPALDFLIHSKWPHMSKANTYYVGWYLSRQNRFINMGYKTLHVNSMTLQMNSRKLPGLPPAPPYCILRDLKDSLNRGKSIAVCPIEIGW